MSRASLGKEPIRLFTSYLKATISGVEYHWVGGHGTVLSSFERGIRRGDVRAIGNVVFCATSVDRVWWLRRVGWAPVQTFDHEFLKEFKAAMFA